MTRKINTADKHFSLCVRLRSDWNCDACEKNFAHEKHRLQCSHFITAARWTIRYHPLNVFAHCVGCHQKLGGGRWGGGNVAEFARHYDIMYGSDNREVMRIMSHRTFYDSKKYYKDICTYFLKTSQWMQAERDGGATGRLEFERFTGCDLLNDIEREARNAIHI